MVQLRSFTVLAVTFIAAASARADDARIYVMPPVLAELPADLQATVSATVAQVSAEEGLSVMTDEDAQAILKTMAGVQSLGADASSIDLAGVGRAIGAKHMLATTVTRVGEDMLVQMRLIDSTKSKVLSRREMRTSDYDGDLVETVKAATRLTLAPIFAHLKGSVELTVTEEGANVLVDGVQIGVAPIDVFAIPGGFHTIAVTKEGFIKHQEDVRIGGGDLIQRMIKLRPSEEYLKAYNARAGLYRTLAWVATTVALAAGGGAYFFAGKKSDQDDESTALSNEYNALSAQDQVTRRTEFQTAINDSKNDANQFGTNATIAGSAAGVFSLSALYFWIFGDDPGRYDEYSQ